MIDQRQIVRACKARGWTIHPDALGGLRTALHTEPESENDDNDDLGNNGHFMTDEERLSKLLDGLKPFMTKKGGAGRSVTLSVWNEWMESSATAKALTTKNNKTKQQSRTDFGKRQSHQSSNIRTTRSNSNTIQVVQAYATPQLVFQSMRRQFQVLDSNSRRNTSLLGTADDKIAMLAQRYALIHQRVVRHDLFRPSSDWHLNPASAAGQLKITPIESLLGQKESHTSCSNTNPQQNNSHVVLLLGILLQIEQGVYYLEDPTGQVQITLQDAVLTDGSFLTEHSMILVEGHVRDGVVHVHRIGQPLQETRALALRTLQQQVSHPAFAFPARIQKEQDRTTFCILQDVHMDQPRVVQQLECLFAYHENTLEGSSVTPAAGQGPPIFVLMGNFCSPQALATIAPTPAALSQLVQAALDDLQALILAFPTLAAQAHFVIVPGPLDSINRVLPFPPLIMHSSSSKAVDNIHWASNPCRIRWNAKEMVIFRFELLPLLLQHQIRLPSDAAGQVPNEDDCDDDEAQQQFKQQETHLREPHCRLLKTILDQGTLMPLTSVVPVYWNVHHALGLYPLPHCLILGGNCMGDGAAPSFETYHECHVIQTTSLSHGGPYAVYRPGANNSDGLKQDDDDDYSADSEENYAQGNDPARQGLIEFLLPDSSDLNLP